MTLEEKYKMAHDVLEFVRGFTSPQMEGFQTEEDRILFNYVNRVLQVLKEEGTP